MFTRKEVPKYQRMIESEIEHILVSMKVNDPLQNAYDRNVNQVKTLVDLLEKDKPNRLSAETRATIVANLVGILMIIKHERVNVITSKALSFVIKAR